MKSTFPNNVLTYIFFHWNIVILCMNDFLHCECPIKQLNKWNVINVNIFNPFSLYYVSFKSYKFFVLLFSKSTTEPCSRIRKKIEKKLCIHYLCDLWSHNNICIPLRTLCTLATLCPMTISIVTLIYSSTNYTEALRVASCVLWMTLNDP